MALEFFDGFDDYGAMNTSLASVYNFSTTIYTNFVTGSFGVGQALNCPSNSFAASRALLTPQTSLIVGARFSSGVSATQATSGVGFEFLNASGVLILTVLIQFGVNPNLIVYTGGSRANGGATGPSGTVLSNTVQPQIPNSALFELEAMPVIGSGTSGSVIVKFNGTTILNLTGVNTQGSVSGSIAYAGLILSCDGAFNSTSADDFYINDTSGSAPDNTFFTTVAGPMGPRVWTGMPDSNDQSQWTPLSGTSNYAMVDETSFDGDTTYIYTSTAGEQDLYGIPAYASITNVLAVQTSFVARMDDSGTREVSMGLQSAGTTYQGATRTMTASYQKFFDLYVDDPATSATWSPSKFTTTGNINIGPYCVL